MILMGIVVVINLFENLQIATFFNENMLIYFKNFV